MASIYKCCHDKTIRPGKGWTDKDGTRHPSNWQIWSVAEKEAHGITEIVLENPPDSRLYTWSQNADGTINKTAKSLDDYGEVRIVDVETGETEPVLDEEGNQRIALGVKSNLKQAVNSQQGSLLIQTDWMYIRKVDKAVEIPAHIQSWRDAIRVRGDEMKAAIDGAADMDAVAALFVAYDENNEKSGILYDWPEME
jgi:hypothetical protein